MDVFSTCWNASRHSDGGAICDEIRELGFDYIEASHGLSVSKMSGIMKAVDEKRIRVAGVHNFCPSPIEVLADAPDAYRFTSHRPIDRERALRLTQETLLMAARLEAKYVVLHLGRVELMKGRTATRELERMVRHGMRDSREFAEAKGKWVRKRKMLGGLYLERARQALCQLSEEAAKLGVVLAVEGRSHFEQVPGEWEMLPLMEEFRDNPNVVYWHDFGHIQRKHNLLMLDHRQYLQHLQPFLYGAHVNDVRWPARDHRAPFLGGCVDFATLLPSFFRKSMPLTWELSPSVTREEILEVKKRWDTLTDSLPD